ncbi:MAG: alanine--glyoxylate aminotransferase family protein [Planctomycetota bacterium]|nr:alanine--glyoxylate aminotransferase family protein [Planctomycetota bacterium]
MYKQRLFAPGPTPVPEETLLELARPMFHHRTAEYRAMLEQLTGDLRYILQTEQEVYTITGSGSAAMEAAVGNLVARGEKMIAVRGGKFGERWSEIGKAFGADVVDLDIEWGTAVTAGQIAEALRANPDAVAVCIQHCETSTGTACDVQAIADAVGQADACLVVDGITGVGALPFHMDEWGVDVTVTGSQKALMLPAGLAFIACSDKAWTKIDATDAPAYYVDLKAYRKSLAKWDNPWTPANAMVRAALKSIGRIRSEGLETVWAETRRRAEATRAAARALGMDLLSTSPSDSVTALVVPEGVDGAALPKTMAEEFGTRIAGGQAHLKGKIIRFSHMGYVDAFDVLASVGALEMALARLGADVEFGAGVAAAQKVLAAG